MKISFLFLRKHEICQFEGLNADLKGKEGQPQQILVWATLSSFSCPSHPEILVLLSIFFMRPILEDKNIFWKSGNVMA